MIIKKPYAFLIKNFKKIHTVLFVLLLAVLYRTYKVLSVILQLINKEANRLNAISFIDYFIIVIIIISIAVFLTMFILMKHKKKPKLIYLLSFIFYSLITILFIFTYNYFNILQNELISEKIIRMYRDFYFIAIFFEIIIMIIILVRALGFDIKKFDFKKDLEQLDIKQEDYEEVEVNVKINTNKVIGILNRIRRNLLYYIKENKYVFSVLLLIFIVILMVEIPKAIKGGTTSYKLNELYQVNGYEMQVNNSYITNLDYNNKVINGNYFVVVSFNIKDISSQKRFINKSSFILKIGSKKYYPSLKYCNSFIDIAACYKEKTISTKISNNYIAVYSIPTKYIKKNKYFIYEYLITNDKVYSTKVRLKNIYLNKDSETKQLSIGNKLVLNNDIISNNYFLINQYEIGNNFDYEDNNGNIVNISSFTNNLIKLSIDTDIENVSSNKLFKYYAKLYYIIDNNVKSKNIILKKSYNNKYLFIEVDDELELASSIWIEFNVRNNKYKYYLKK